MVQPNDGNDTIRVNSAVFWCVFSPKFLNNLNFLVEMIKLGFVLCTKSLFFISVIFLDHMGHDLDSDSDLADFDPLTAPPCGDPLHYPDLYVQTS